MKKELLIFLSTLLVITSACGNKKPSDNQEADTTLMITEVPLTSLPDTAYESVALIKYTTSLFDSVSNPEINDYHDFYRNTPGIFAFRGNAWRDGDMKGRIKGKPSEIKIDWEYKTDYDNRLGGFNQAWGGGSGWTGQPVYVEWPDSLIGKYQKSGHLAANFSGKEIIVGSLSSYVYFVDFETGEESRAPVFVSNPIKGSISLDPTLNGNIYVGHGVPNQRPFGSIILSLDTHDVSDIFPEDKKAPRHWGAYDSSPIRAGQYLFRPGENGMIYKYTVEPGKQTLHSSLSYTAKGAAPGMESSMSIYRNYGYVADNHGNVICVNLNTMKPVWVYDLGDDTDSTPMIAEEDGTPYVYVGSEIDRSSRGYAKYVKLNGLDGTPVWEREVSGKRFDIGNKHFDGGFYSSTLAGQGNCSEMVFVNFVENLNRQNGKFLALDRKTGKTQYEIPLKHYAWSSPVGFINEKDEMYILTGDCAGNMYLIDAKEGKVLHTLPVGSNFESSPVVAGNSAVVGSRGQKIFRVSVN